MVLLYATIAFSMQASSSPQRSAIFIMSFIVGSIFFWTAAIFDCFFARDAFWSASILRSPDSASCSSALNCTTMFTVRRTRHSDGSSLLAFLPTAEYSYCTFSVAFAPFATSRSACAAALARSPIDNAIAVLTCAPRLLGDRRRDGPRPSVLLHDELRLRGIDAELRRI